MSETKTIAAAGINIIDESFDLKKSNTYHLSILLNSHRSTIAVLDTDTNKYLVLQENQIMPPEFKIPDSLANHFRSVTCAIAHPKFTLAPSALFDEENKKPLLEFNHSITDEEKIHSDTLMNVDAKNIFSISKDIESKIRDRFINVHFIHNATAFIEGVLIQNKNAKGQKMFADLHSSYFEIVLLENGKLIFSNAFQYKAAEDIAYYILFVYEQMHLDPEEVELVVSGEIEKTAKEHSLLYNYIRHVKFASLPDGFKFSYKFDEVPKHKYFSLFTQYLITN